MEIQETIEAPTPEATPLPRPAPCRRGRNSCARRLVPALDRRRPATLAVLLPRGVRLARLGRHRAVALPGALTARAALRLSRRLGSPAPRSSGRPFPGCAFADQRMYATWAMLAVYCSLYFPITVLFLVRLLDRRTPPAAGGDLAGVLGGAGIPALRLRLAASFPCGPATISTTTRAASPGTSLAHSSTISCRVIQISDLGGALRRWLRRGGG